MLASLLDNKTLPLVVAGLGDGNQRTVAAITWALSSARGYSPQLLLGMLDDPALPKGAAGQRDRRAEEPPRRARTC